MMMTIIIIIITMITIIIKIIINSYNLLRYFQKRRL